MNAVKIYLSWNKGLDFFILRTYKCTTSKVGQHVLIEFSIENSYVLVSKVMDML